MNGFVGIDDSSSMMEEYRIGKEIVDKKLPSAGITSLETERVAHDCIEKTTRPFDKACDKIRKGQCEKYTENTDGLYEADESLPQRTLLDQMVESNFKAIGGCRSCNT